jgi:hypothetical protein
VVNNHKKPPCFLPLRAKLFLFRRLPCRSYHLIDPLNDEEIKEKFKRTAFILTDGVRNAKLEDKI